MRRFSKTLALLAFVPVCASAASAPVRLTKPGLPLAAPQVGCIGALLAAPGAPLLSPQLSLSPILASAVPLAAVPVAPVAPAPRQVAVAARPSLEALAEKVQVSDNGQDAAALQSFFDLAAVKAAPAESVLPSVAEDVAARSPFGERFRVPYDPKGTLDLSVYDAGATPGFEKLKHKKKKALLLGEEDKRVITEYSSRLALEGKRAVLSIFLAMDAGGKDGVVSWVLSGVHPQHQKAKGFGKPTEKEAKQDYRVRIEKELPGPGGEGTYNRSQYEDIVVPTVFKTMKWSEIAPRFGQINGMEKRWADELGIVISKYFLLLSKEEQKKRLQERLDDKPWKFDASDLESRKHWKAYHRIFGKILPRTSTPWAPWYIIPSDNKWYRNYAVRKINRETHEWMNPQYPEVRFDPKKIKIPD